jgi:hypothetical protein
VNKNEKCGLSLIFVSFQRSSNGPKETPVIQEQNNHGEAKLNE